MLDPLAPGNADRHPAAEQSTNPTTKRSLYEFEPESLNLAHVSCAQFVSLLEDLELPFPLSFAESIYAAIESGCRPEISEIFRDFDPSDDGYVECSSGWRTSPSGSLPFVEACIGFDAELSDFQKCEVIIRKEDGSDTVSLTVRYDEELLFLDGLHPDRWSAIEKVLEVLKVPGLPGISQIDASSTSFSLTTGAFLTLAPGSNFSNGFRRDPHLALRKELLVAVLGADADIPPSTRANQIYRRIFGSEETEQALIPTAGDLEGAWTCTAEARRRGAIVMLEHEGLIVPICRACTLEILRADVATLIELRTQIKAREPDPSLVAPIRLVSTDVADHEAAAIFNAAGYEIPPDAIAHIREVFCEGAPFDSQAMQPDSGTITLRHGESLQISPMYPPELSCFLSLEGDARPRIVIFGHDPSEELEDTLPDGELIDETPDDGFGNGEEEMTTEDPALLDLEEGRDDEETEEDDGETGFDTGANYEEPEESSEPSDGFCTELTTEPPCEGLAIVLSWKTGLAGVSQSAVRVRWDTVETISKALGRAVPPDAFRFFSTSVNQPRPAIEAPQQRIHVTKCCVPPQLEPSHG